MIKQDRNSWIGWIEGFRIRDVVTLVPDLIRRFPFALITCVDSSRHEDVQMLLEHALQQADLLQYKAVKNGMLIGGNVLVELLDTKYHLFNGFDEVWLSEKEPSDDLSLSSPITSEVTIADENTGADPSCSDWHAEAIAWMAKSNFVLGFGDGVGLNYLTSSRMIAQEIAYASELHP